MSGSGSQSQKDAIVELRTQLPNARQTPRFAGVATFCRFPQLESVASEHRPVDWAVYGVPYDLGVTYRPGARFGPRAVRNESQYIKPVHIEHGVNIAQALSIADAGDAPVGSFDLETVLKGVAEFAQRIGNGGGGHTKLLAIGGDHSVAYANIKATWNLHGKPRGGLALLHFDAHLDTVDVISQSKWSHGSVFRRAIEEQLIDPKRMLSIGVRGPLNSLDDLKFIQQAGGRMISMQQIAQGDVRQAIAQFVSKLAEDGDRPTYLSFDVDCVDPAFAPGTGTPTCGGLSSAEAFNLLRACAGVNLVGADVVEVLPDRDVAGITALLAAHVMFEILSLAAVKQKR